MRTPPGEVDSGDMRTRPAAPAPPTTPPVPAPDRVRASAVLLLLSTVVLAFLVLSVSYGLGREYGDATAADLEVAGRALRDWGLPMLVVGGLGLLTVRAARRSRWRRGLTTAAVVAVTLTLVGVPTGAVVGAHRKLASFPEVPPCTAGFSGGPAVPVVRAAQAAFEELAHPGPFSGGGESGVDGCASQLMVPDDVDVPAAYRRSLAAAGWRLGQVGPDRVEATRGDQRFTASRDRHAAWWVRIGPDGVR